jgi:hypothetical protein
MTTKTQLEQFAIANKKQVDVCGPMIAVEWSKGVWYHFRAYEQLNDMVTFVKRYSHTTDRFEKGNAALNRAADILGKAQMVNA